MNKVLAPTIACVVMILVGFTLVTGLNNPLAWIIGGSAMMSGILLFVYIVIVHIGQIRPKIYRFIHLYNQADILDNQSMIVKKLDKKDIAQLQKKLGVDSMHKAFKYTPVIVDITQILKFDGYPHKKIIGWIYATDQDEALRTLHYQEFGKDEPNNTPAFFR
jgi:hypothetical protein